MARWASYRMEREEPFDILRWLDRTLIKLASKFGQYVPNQPESFSLDSQFSYYPQLNFHLRRSQFLQFFNNSPDETAFYKHCLNKETLAESLVMIQPEIFSYGFEADAYPVLLDANAIQADKILLLDSYFTVVIFHGSLIANWRNQKYHEMEEYVDFKDLLSRPHIAANEILAHRFPAPKLVVCDSGGSQARYLLAKLNPSSTHNSQGIPSHYGEGIIFTDDVSLQVFQEHLRKLAVQQSS